ncbi:M12 family metallopeptidase [Aliikangiella sp. G2MR2-5]|uniref:M12 family metallopeptidase n=1 Tax=Aliikangiella sp. G2MR2-5 TaxID=2788943 RepID=UPI0018ABC4D1|nr:M12 family metallopeptidase [Aliikangiella sp. G2MR2-5]
MKLQTGKILIGTLFFLAAQFSLADTNTLNSSAIQPQKSNLKKHDSIWGYSSKGREVIEVVTDDGHVFEAVDVDGYVHLGDMILGKTEDIKQYGLRIAQGETAPDIADNDSLFDTKAAIRYPSSGYKWPNGTVPYVYASSLGSKGRSAMNYAINHWNSKTNLNFIPRTNQSSYLLIQGGGGCSSWIGMQGGQQVVTLAEGCGNGAAVHELGHAVGFFHEQTRTDRDNYVTIYWNNIQSGMAYNFNKMTSSDGQNYGNYDYYSIMHYRTTAFGINNAVTIWPTQNGVDTNYMGNGSVLSATDIAAAAAIYGNGSGGGDSYSGSLSGANDSDIQPNGNWFQYSGGTLKATLSGPSNADFDLKLFRWNGSWVEVARSESPTSNESINYNASSGYYYFEVYSYSGSGSYTLNIQK